MTLRLLIKGDLATATKVAAHHGVPFKFVCETDGATVGRSPNMYRPAIERWFSEPPHRAPYPPGTLLHFVWEGLDNSFPTPEPKR